jgi:hypothetical protein
MIDFGTKGVVTGLLEPADCCAMCSNSTLVKLGCNYWTHQTGGRCVGAVV